MSFLRKHAQHYRKNLEGFEEAAMDLMLDNRWPGNIRELECEIDPEYRR